MGNKGDFEGPDGDMLTVFILGLALAGSNTLGLPVSSSDADAGILGAVAIYIETTYLAQWRQI